MDYQRKQESNDSPLCRMRGRILHRLKWSWLRCDRKYFTINLIILN